MQQAAIPGYRLSRAKLSTKVLTTCGLSGLLIGLISAAALTVSRTGLGASAVRAYYLGEQAGVTGVDGLLSATSPRPFAELAEVTHLHLVGGTMLLFLLCHLLSVCNVSERVRVSLYLTSFLSFLVTFSLPWVIVYCSPFFAYLFGPAMILFVLTLALLSSIPILEMWFLKS